MGAHALLGPSSAKRWIECPGSVRLTENMPDRSSAEATEGTLAHEIGENILLYNSKQLSKQKFYPLLKKLQADPLYNAEMLDHCEAYADYVHAMPGELLVEQRLDLSEWFPECFGTGDAIKVTDDLLTVVDLKYGKGVPVVAQDNPQLKCYALGAFGALSTLYDFSEVEVHIFQPRVGAPTSARYTVEELLIWAEEARPQAQKAFDGVQEFKSGEWCQFCKNRPTCRTKMEQEAAKAFSDVFVEPEEVKDLTPNQMSEDEILYWLPLVKPICKFLGDLEDYARDEAEKHGRKFKGWKLVEGRSNRKYDDAKSIIDLLDKEEGLEPGYAERVLLGVTALEKHLGKKIFESLVSPHLVKAPGKPALVPATDKRPELNSAAEAQSVFND